MSFTTFSTQQNGAVLQVTLNNGEVNMMTAVMAAELFALVGQLSVDTQTRVVMFESANPDFFIAHFDVDDIVKLIDGDPSIPVSKTPGLNVLQALGLSIQSLAQVTVAKVDGACRGGGFEFMLALDMCFASDRSRFCFPEAASGFLPAGGGSTMLPLKAGSSRALEIMLTGRDFSGSEAAQYNFVNRTFASHEAMDDYVAALAKDIAAKDLAVIQAIKSVSRATVAPMKDGLLAGLAQENTAMTQCLSDPVVLERLRRLAAVSGTRESELDLPATIAGKPPCDRVHQHLRQALQRDSQPWRRLTPEPASIMHWRCIPPDHAVRNDQTRGGGSQRWPSQGVIDIRHRSERD